MLSYLKKLLKNNSTGFSALLHEGGIIVDVRSAEEFRTGHVKGSVNIPLAAISSRISDLKKYPAIIVCCRSGNRSGMAKSILEKNGIGRVYNGGSWQNVNKHVR